MEHAAGSPAREVCGLLLGRPGHVTDWRAAANVADDPARRFEIDPVALIGAHKVARAGGPAIVGCYHSHPNGSTEPSPCDAAMALVDAGLWLILAPPRFALWRAGARGLHGRFAQVTPIWT